MTDNEKLKVVVIAMKFDLIYKHHVLKLTTRELRRLRRCQKKFVYFLEKKEKDESLNEEDMTAYENLDGALNTLIYRKKEFVR